MASPFATVAAPTLLAMPPTEHGVGNASEDDVCNGGGWGKNCCACVVMEVVVTTASVAVVVVDSAGLWREYGWCCVVGW